MASPSVGGYSKLRFQWKSEVNASASLSRSAKQVAVFLCDKYVNRDTGCCWPKNRTLAQKMGLSERTVQRRIKELRRGGWLCPVKIKTARRGLKITFPLRAEGDIQTDSLSPTSMTKLSSKNDTGVTHYKNQVNNQVKTGLTAAAHKTLPVRMDETGPLREWQTWLSVHPVYDLEVMLPMLRNGQSYMFPSRFPIPNDNDRYEKYFDDVLASQGRIISGQNGGASKVRATRE